MQVHADHDINLNDINVYGQFQPRSLLLDGMTESSSLQRQTKLVDDTAFLLNFFTGVDTAANGSVLALSATANAGIIIPAGDWTLDVNGNVNAFANWTSYDTKASNDARGVTAAQGGLVAGADGTGEV